MSQLKFRPYQQECLGAIKRQDSEKKYIKKMKKGRTEKDSAQRKGSS